MNPLRLQVKQLDKKNWAVRNMDNPDYEFPYYESFIKMRDKLLYEIGKHVKGENQFTIIVERHK